MKLRYETHTFARALATLRATHSAERLMLTFEAVAAAFRRSHAEYVDRREREREGDFFVES